MYCATCGALIEDGSRFCRHCGTPTGETPAPELDYSGLTIDAETGRPLGETSLLNEPTRRLYDVASSQVPTSASAGVAEADSAAAAVVAGAAGAAGVAVATVTAVPGSSQQTQVYPKPQPYEEASAPDLAPELSGYRDVSAYQARRSRSNGSPVALAIAAAVALAAMLVIIAHLSGVAPWVRHADEEVHSAEVATEEPAEELAEEEVEAEEATEAAEPVPDPESEEEAQVAPEVVEVSEFVLAESDVRTYTADELAGLSDWELFAARNEIYARHGRQFQNDLLQDYFGHLSWYNGTIAPEAFDESVLSAVEQANVATILQAELARNSPYV